MAATVDLVINDRTVTVRELTVAEVRDWAVRVDAGLLPVDPVGALISADWSLADLREMSNAQAEQLEAMTFAELEKVADAAKRLNPHFFALRAALLGAANRIAELALRNQSNETSAD
jgi:hypothetical protein